MTSERPLILLTNDDGVDAPGLKYLIESVRNLGDIMVFAPTSAQSGKSSAITVEEPLRVFPKEETEGLRIMAVNGTPVDCVKLGLHILGKRRPDIILSGINHGSNSGNSIIYSGTMGAVIEGCMAGMPSIGFSLLHHSWAADFSQCGDIIMQVAGKVLESGLPKETCLNVNIPARCVPKGIKVTEASPGHWTEEYAEYTDPHGRQFYMLTGRFIDDDPNNPDYDNYWLDREYATVVPVHPDQTSREAIPSIKNILGEV